MREGMTVVCRYGGREYGISVQLVRMTTAAGVELVHVRAPDALRREGPLFELGRRRLEDLIEEAVKAGRISRARGGQCHALSRPRAGLPTRGMRVERKVCSPRVHKDNVTLAAEEADGMARHLARQFADAGRLHHEGKLTGVPAMDTARFLRICLEADVVRLLREADYQSLATVEELRRLHAARRTLNDADSSPKEKETAQAVLEGFEGKLDTRYAAYHRKRAELLNANLSDEQLRKEVDRLRKSRSAPEGKGLVRLLKNENSDLSLYAPYEAAMELVFRELAAAGYLTDGPSRALFQFMHGAHEFLLGVVPALHPIGPVFLRSKEFLAAVVDYGSEDLDGHGGKALGTVAGLYGAALACASAYAGAVVELRGADAGRGAEGAGCDGPRGAVRGGFDWSRSTLDHSGRRQYQPLCPELQLLEADRDRRLLTPDYKPLVGRELLQEMFGEEGARKVEVYLRRRGLCGYGPTAVSELAAEYGRGRTSIWRWCREGEALLAGKAREMGLDPSVIGCGTPDAMSPGTAMAQVAEEGT
jgi:hypothetical protein